MKSRHLVLVLSFFAAQLALMSVGPIFLKPMFLAVAALAVLFVFLSYLIGLYAVPQSIPYRPIAVMPQNLIPYTLVSILCSLYAANFYTGSLLEGYVNLALGVSNYNDYQRFFAEQGLSGFSVSKLPAIFASAYVKFVLLVSIYALVFRGVTVLSVLSVVFAVVAVAHFSISRGTSYEFFEILLYAVFLYAIRSAQRRDGIRLRSVFWMLALVLIMLYLYKANIDLRYGGPGQYQPGCISGLCYDENSFVARWFPDFSVLLFKLNGYFSFGLIYFVSLIDFFAERYPGAVLIPGVVVDSQMQERFLCVNGWIDCGAMWSPSAEYYLLRGGAVGLLGFAFLVGATSGLLINNLKRRVALELVVLLYFNYLIVISLYTGYLFSTSSANILIYVVMAATVVLRGFVFTGRAFS